MKKIYLFISIISVIAFGSVNVSAMTSDNHSNSSSIPQFEVASADSESVDNLIRNLSGRNVRGLESEYSVDSAIGVVYSPDDFKSLHINPVGEIYQSNIALRTLGQINERYPFEFLERVNEQLIYAAYKVQDGDNNYFMYLFFTKANDESSNTSSDYNSWILNGRSFTISQPLEFADFADIKIGSKLSQVAEIEPLAINRKPLDYIPERINERFDNSLNQYVEDIIPPPEKIEYSDYYYLKDGILVISFSKPNNPDDEFIVTDVKFDNTFMVETSDNNTNLRSSASGLQLKIFEKDFPNN